MMKLNRTIHIIIKHLQIWERLKELSIVFFLVAILTEIYAYKKTVIYLNLLVLGRP
jgi:hypothetical protein